MSFSHISLSSTSPVSLPQTHNLLSFTIIHTSMQKLWNPLSAACMHMDLGLAIWDWITHQGTHPAIDCL